MIFNSSDEDDIEYYKEDIEPSSFKIKHRKSTLNDVECNSNKAF